MIAQSIRSFSDTTMRRSELRSAAWRVRIDARLSLRDLYVCARVVGRATESAESCPPVSIVSVVVRAATGGRVGVHRITSLRGDCATPNDVTAASASRGNTIASM
jgi:hypothetical protein